MLVKPRLWTLFRVSEAVRLRFRKECVCVRERER